jgi:two-component system sensor histidine kinase UhpB
MPVFSNLSERPAPGPQRRSVRSALRWSWMPIRTQLLVAIALVCIVAAVVTGILAIIRANDRARVEVNATLEIAERLIAETVRGVPENTPPETVLSYVSPQLRHFRHVRTSFRNAEGKTSLILQPPTLPNSARGAPDRAPQWFEHLVSRSIETREVPVTAGGKTIGTFIISGEPADEIAEVWDDLSEMSIVAAILVASMLVMLYIVLGRVLGPLNSFSKGMQELEVGHYGTRLTVSNVKELEPIVTQFNALAGALDSMRAENRELLGHLINVQEDERRQVATELHDEAGPCLFGITANAGSILNLASAGGEKLHEQIKERVNVILTSAERLKAVNRGLLKTLRPIAIGRVSLEELLSDLVTEFEKRHPDVGFFLAIEPIAPRYGEAVELTIYRCLQQGLTNALQHGAARNIDASLLERPSATSPDAKKELVLTMTDDGIGVPERTPVGFGLSAMRERVHALDGTCTIKRAEPRGTTIEIIIPVAGAGQERPRPVLTSEIST